ncbi:MAG: hypothetical protein ACRDWT_04975 [Jatrophihabitantaceae bacterium]
MAERQLAQAPRRHRGLYWAAVLLSLVGIVGGSVVAYLGYEQTAGPAGAVKGYFAALEQSDAARALAYGDVPAGPHTLLTAEVLREQQEIAPIRDVKIVSVEHHGSDAMVGLAYNLDYRSGAQAVSDTVRVHHRGSSWQLAETAVPTSIRITQASDRATIVGAGVPGGTTLLFPGAVPVRFDTPYLQVAAGTGRVTFGTGHEVDLTVAVSAAGRRAVAGALAAGLSNCFTGTRADLRCPLPSDRFVPGSLSGRLAGSVADRMQLDVAATDSGLIDVSGTVPFVGTYRELDFNDIASTHRGTVQIPLASTTYIKPIQLQWLAPQ